MKIAIIGGSLLGSITAFEQVSQEKIKTPFGQPSDVYSIGEIAGQEAIYFNRHGHDHFIAPHQINYRANMFVLKMLEVTDILAVTAVGGITGSMSPMTWVVPDQLIDYTHGRMQTYNDGNDHEVKHIDFTCPFSEVLRTALISALQKENLDGQGMATYGTTQGPRLETAAEIRRMQQDGCDIVGMTAMPEASLARELEMNYATISLVVNWAAGKGSTAQGDESQTTGIVMDEIKRRINSGNQIVEAIIGNAIKLCYADVNKSD